MRSRLEVAQKLGLRVDGVTRFARAGVPLASVTCRCGRRSMLLETSGAAELNTWGQMRVLDCPCLPPLSECIDLPAFVASLTPEEHAELDQVERFVTQMRESPRRAEMKLDEGSTSTAQKRNVHLNDSAADGDGNQEVGGGS